MTTSPTKSRALALYDSGQRIPAARVAGGQTYLDQWLIARGSPRIVEDEISDGHLIAKRQGHTKDPRTKRKLAAIIANRHLDLGKPNDQSLVYHVDHTGGRDFAEMRRLAAAIRAAAGAVIGSFVEFNVWEIDILTADSQADPIKAYNAQNARAAFVTAALYVAPDLTDAELAKTIGVEPGDIPDIKTLDRAEGGINGVYRDKSIKTKGAAQKLYDALIQKVAPPSTEGGG